MIPNAYPGDEIFQKNLAKMGASMSIWEIRMYLLGILLSPERVTPSMALEEILLTDTEDEVEFRDENDYMEFMNLFVGLWNQLITYDGSESRYPKLAPHKTKFKDKADKAAYIASKGEELSSFYMGLDVSGASEYFDQYFELVKAQVGFSIINDLLIDFCIDYSEGKKLSDKKLNEMLAVVDDFHQNWPKTYPKLNKIFLGIRRGEISLDSEDEMERKLEEFKQRFE